MGIGRYRDLDIHFFGHFAENLVQIQAVRVRVEFHETTPFHGRLHQALQVDIIWIALINQAAGGVRQNIEIRIVHGPQDAFGLLLTRKLEIGMNSADHHIQFL